MLVKELQPEKACRLAPPGDHNGWHLGKGSSGVRAPSSLACHMQDVLMCVHENSDCAFTGKDRARKG